MFKEKLAKNPKLVNALEKAGWKLEQRIALPIAEGAAKDLGRAVMKQTAEQVLEKAAAEEAASVAAKAVAKTAGKKVLKSGATKLVSGIFGGPIVEGVMLAWTAYDLVMIIPDLVQIVGGIPTSIADLKFPGDSYRNGAEDLYRLANHDEKPITLNPKDCGC